MCDILMDWLVFRSLKKSSSGMLIEIVFAICSPPFRLTKRPNQTQIMYIESVCQHKLFKMSFMCRFSGVSRCQRN